MSIQFVEISWNILFSFNFAHFFSANGSRNINVHLFTSSMVGLVWFGLVCFGSVRFWCVFGHCSSVKSSLIALYSRFHTEMLIKLITLHQQQLWILFYYCYESVVALPLIETWYQVTKVCFVFCLYVYFTLQLVDCFKYGCTKCIIINLITFFMCVIFHPSS